MAKRDLTPEELAKVEAKMKTFMANKDSWVKRYGKDAEKVMRGRAITSVKKETETMDKQKLKELVRKSLMNEADIEVGAEKYFGEKDLSKASMMLDDLETKLKNHDWFYMMSDDNRAYTKGSLEQQSIRNIMKSLEDMGYGEDAKSLFNQYAPNGPGGSTLKMKEAKKSFPDLTGDGKVTKADILKGRGVKIDEDIDLGHEDNEPHMIKGELYQIGKYAMELYAALEELEKAGGEYDFPAWWQSKITTAKNNISGAKHYLEFELNEPKIDSAVDALTGEEYHEGEPGIEEGLPKGFFKKEFGVGGKKKIKEGSYPFDKCLKDQTPKYGVKGAKKVCGAIKAAYGE